MLLVMLTMTYAKKVLVMVVSKIIDRAMRIIMKGELAKAPATCRQAHFSVVMSGSHQLLLKYVRGKGASGRGYPLQQLLIPLCIGSSA